MIQALIKAIRCKKRQIRKLNYCLVNFMRSVSQAIKQATNYQYVLSLQFW